MVKGIILAGGKGTRLYPITKAVSKQLLPVYNKPMIFLPLYLLKKVGVKDILIIVNPYDLHLFKKLLGNGNKFGLNISYKIQKEPNGIAEAFLISKSFLKKFTKVMLILGDNFFYGANLFDSIKNALNSKKSASIFTYKVSKPELYGVLKIKNGKTIKIEEKPRKPSSNLAIPGLYIYNQSVIKNVKLLKPSDRGELEITDLNNIYFKDNDIHIQYLDEGITWMDMGSFDSYLDASLFISSLEKRKGYQVYNPTE